MSFTTTFTAPQLNLPDDVIAQIEAALANADNPDPIGDAITQQLQVVNDYTLRYAMPDERVIRLVRPLVLWSLYSNPALGAMPPNVDSGYKAAMKELQDIRDGKFHDLALANPSDPNLAGPLGGWGSKHRVSFDRGGHPDQGGEI